MKAYGVLLSLVACGLLAGLGVAAEPVVFQLDAFTARPPGVTFQDFNGAVYLPTPDMSRALGIGWTRHDFSWGAIEPENDRWEWANTDRLVLQAHAQGLDILPLLAYTAPWAAGKPGDGFSPPHDVADWEDYVEHVVARYIRPPFNLRYFQVWNEPTWEPMTFWHASGREWVDQVYLPAARIIRRYGCQVVFGGWPVADAGNLFRALDYHDADRWTDIVDIHYFENSTWQEIHDRYVKPGICRGIWQTEIGFHTFPNYLPNCYLRALHWALRNGWSEPNQYKLFWFASWGAGADGPKCLTQPGPDDLSVLTEHGKRLAVMNEVLSGGGLAVFSDFRTQLELAPRLTEEAPTVLGFRVGEERIVIALLLDAPTHEKNPTVLLDVRPPGAPQRAVMVTATGERHDLTLRGARKAGNGTPFYEVAVPVRRVPLDVARGWGGEYRAAVAYVVID